MNETHTNKHSFVNDVGFSFEEEMAYIEKEQKMIKNFEDKLMALNSTKKSNRIIKAFYKAFMHLIS